MRKMLAVGRKEFRQIARDRRSLMVLLFVPAFFLLLYGYALSFDVQNIQLAIHDNDRTPASRDLAKAFVNSGYFRLSADVSDAREYEELIDRGEVRAVLVIPLGFQRDLMIGERVPVQLIINGDNANTATTVMGYALGILRAATADYQQQAVTGTPMLRASATGTGAAPLSVETRVWYNPELRSALFLIPGLIAYIGMISAVVSTSLSVVREKERGTMEQVRMAPLGTAAYIAGKTLPYFAISLGSSVFIVLASMVLFDLPMNGSWLLLLVALSLYLVGALALGLMISTIAESQQVAFQISVLASFLPTMILSGFVFPIASMPAPIQAITYIVPARYFIVALRAIVLKGAALSTFWTELVALAVYAMVMLTFASKRLERQWVQP
jgi:drug efflux transport system permease protein